MEIDEGFILSNKFRRIIFDEFASGQTNLNYIIKKNHMIRRVAEKVTNEFIEGGILKKQGNGYILTEKGEKLSETL